MVVLTIISTEATGAKKSSEKFDFGLSGNTFVSWALGDDGELTRHHVENCPNRFAAIEQLHARCRDIFPILDPLLGNAILSNDYDHEKDGNTIRFSAKLHPRTYFMKKWPEKVTGTANLGEDDIVLSCRISRRGKTVESVVTSQKPDVPAKIFDLPKSLQAKIN